MHTQVEGALKDIFAFHGVKISKPVLGLKKLIDEKKISKQQLERYNELQDTKKKLSKAESQKMRRVARLFVKNIAESIQKRKSKTIEKSAYTLKYGDKQCKAYLFETVVFLVEDEESKRGNVIKIEVKNDVFSKPSKIELKEFYEYIGAMQIPARITLTEKYLKEFEKVFGKEVTLYLH